VSDARVAVGVDVGGTKINAFRVTGGGEVLARETVPTPADDMAAILDAMVGAAQAVLAPDVAAVGVGAAGLVEFATGIVAFAPNLAFREARINDHLGAALGLPVVTDNDANVAALAESRFGAGRGYDHVLLVTVGTGIGGGIVSGGRLFRGAHGFAAEIGHVIVEPGGPPCGCGNRGCWEQVASGHALARAGREAVRRHPGSLIARMAAGDPRNVAGPVVTDAAQQGDDVARRILAEVGRRLGEGIAGLVNVLDPEVVVVGGGAIAAGHLLLDPARAAFLDAVESPEHRPDVPIVPASLGNDAGAIGAAALALEETG
jgi:glucokinase